MECAVCVIAVLLHKDFGAQSPRRNTVQGFIACEGTLPKGCVVLSGVLDLEIALSSQ